jgi:hypothetical protein
LASKNLDVVDAIRALGRFAAELSPPEPGSPLHPTAFALAALGPMMARGLLLPKSGYRASAVPAR